jgi:FMN phosphatase YigB (HAD superfamily)
LITTLLLDLDDTLLSNNMNQFLPAYLQRFGDFMKPEVQPEKFVGQLLIGTKAMIENEDPTRTMEQVFAKAFYPALSLDEKQMQPKVEQFYHEIFPGLRSITGVRSGARELVEAAFTAGIEVVIATSPLFPLTAIEQRLAWAGVPRDEFSFSIITSYESFHFSKPHLAYYTEIMGRLGKPLHEAAMIGNDTQDDLKPASTLGMAVFHVDDDPQPPYIGGTLHEAIQWLEQASSQSDPKMAQEPPVLLARLRGYLAALLAMVEDLPSELMISRPKETEWSPLEIICHLRDVDIEVNRPRLELILTSEEAHLPAFDTDRWAEERKYQQQDGRAALSDFVEARLELIQSLSEILAEDWERKARHTLFGPTTLGELIGFAAEHDLLHLAQMRATLDHQRLQISS